MNPYQFKKLLEDNSAHEAYQRWSRKSLIDLQGVFGINDPFYSVMYDAIAEVMKAEEVKFLERIENLKPMGTQEVELEGI